MSNLTTKQVNSVNLKLNQTTVILSELRYNTSLRILKIVYHSLFGSHLQYGARSWGQGNCVNQNNIQNLRNWALRKITFKKLQDPVDTLYKDLNILQLKELLHLQNCLFVLQIEHNQILANCFVTPKHCGDNLNY